MKQFAVLYRAAGGEGGAGMQAPEGEALQGQITREQTVQEAGVREERTFTQADVDRIVQQTIARERKRSDAAVATARTEAERLAGMSAEQRLVEREAAVQRRELRAQALETLAQRGLPRELAGVLSYESAEACNESIANAEKAFRAAVKRGVDERMKGVPPKSGTGETESTLLSQMRVAAGLKK